MHPPLQFRDLLQAAAGATNEYDFKVAMDSIKGYNQEAYNYLMKEPAKYRSRSAFDTDCSSDNITNYRTFKEKA